MEENLLRGNYHLFIFDITNGNVPVPKQMNLTPKARDTGLTLRPFSLTCHHLCNFLS